jgi:hypothetical protein
MTGGEISGNVVSNMSTANIISGGGVCVYGNNGTFAMTGGTILSNSVQAAGKAYGGGVHVEDGSAFTMSGGEVVDNTAKVEGGGVNVASGFTGNTFNLSGKVDISGNTDSSGSSNVG